jgi:hypothetical protein
VVWGSKVEDLGFGQTPQPLNLGFSLYLNHTLCVFLVEPYTLGVRDWELRVSGYSPAQYTPNPVGTWALSAHTDEWLRGIQSRFIAASYVDHVAIGRYLEQWLRNPELQMGKSESERERLCVCV